MDFIMLFYETTYETVTGPHETGGLIGLSWSCNWSHTKPLILKDGLIGLMVSISRRYSEEIDSEKSLTKGVQRPGEANRRYRLVRAERRQYHKLLDRLASERPSPESQKQAYPRKPRIMKELPCLH